MNSIPKNIIYRVKDFCDKSCDTLPPPENSMKRRTLAFILAETWKNERELETDIPDDYDWKKDEIQNMKIDIDSMDMLFNVNCKHTDKGSEDYLIGRQIINNVPIYFNLTAFRSHNNDPPIRKGKILFCKSPQLFAEKCNLSNYQRNRLYIFLIKFRSQSLALKSMQIDIKSVKDILNKSEYILLCQEHLEKKINAEESEKWNDIEFQNMIIDINSIDTLFYVDCKYTDFGYEYYLVGRQKINDFPIYFSLDADADFDESIPPRGDILFCKSLKLFIENYPYSNCLKERIYNFLNKPFDKKNYLCPTCKNKNLNDDLYPIVTIHSFNVQPKVMSNM